MKQVMTIIPCDNYAAFGGKPGPKVGDVIYTSYGYSMTLNDFAKVVSVSKSGKTVTCVLVGAKTIDGHLWGPGGGRVKADPDTELDRPKFRLHVRMNSDGTWYLRGSYPFCHGSKRMGTWWKDAGGGHYENHWD